MPKPNKGELIMLKQKRLTVLSMAVMLALLMAAVMPMSALADDGVPPQPEAPVVVDEPVVDVPAVVDVPVVEEPMTVPEILAEVPAGTDVVVLDENGEALPLVSAEAAETILAGDPIWCIEGKDPTTGAAGECTQGYVSIGLMLLDSDYQADVNGTIFFTATYTGVGPVTLTGMGTGVLTLQGGWNGMGNNALFGVTDGAFALAGNTTINNQLEVLWNNSVIVNNFTIHNTANTDGGLSVETITGDITIDHVISSDNNGGGAYFESAGDIEITNSAFNNNDYGAYIYAEGDVVVENSTFNNNDKGVAGDTKGLNVAVHGGDVTLTNVTANNNYGDGVNIYGIDDTTGPGKVNITGSQFNGNYSDETNYGTGLYIAGGQDDITLNNVDASFNDYHGVEVVGTAGDIKVNGGYFEANGWGIQDGDGLHLTADGDITLNGVVASSNYDDNAELCAGGDVNINGSSFYSGWSGLYIKCAEHVYSSGNYYWGNYWGNYWGYPSYWSGYYYGYNDYYWYGSIPIWDGPSITINNIYVDGYFIPDYGTYYNFYNSYYYGFGWYTGWGSGYWHQRWLQYQFPVIETAPMSVEIAPLTEDKLPGELPADKTFADAFEATVSGGIPGEVTEAFFSVPAGFVDGDTLTVLSWDGTEWVEVESEIVDGKVTFKISESGIFALVTP
jgi:hypothetical protein